MVKKAIIKNKSGKFKKAIKLAGLFLAGASVVLIPNYAIHEIVNKVESSSVDEALEYYGGIDKYLSKKGILQSYSKIGNDNKIIIVGLDSTVDEKCEEQFKICFDYLNKLFETINKDYQFELVRTNSKLSCNISISFEDYKNSSVLSQSTDGVAIKYNNVFNYLNVNYSKIVFNNAIKNDYSRIRVTTLHEIFHVLLDNGDLEWYKPDVKYNHYSVPYSVLSYAHGNNMRWTFHNASKSKELENINKEYDEYIYNKFITYTPFDIAALASRFGNIKDEQNKKDCTNLIINTYKNCKEVFGDKKYFLEEIELNSEGYPVKFDEFLQNFELNNSGGSNYNKTTYSKLNEIEFEKE